MNMNAYLYVFDTMADWEPGYLIAELNSGRYFRQGQGQGQSRLPVVTVGITREPVATMGGISIVPDITVEECQTEKAAALILPGGNTWMEDIHWPVLKKAEAFLQEGIVVGAICGATFGISRAGLLDSRWHTSNNLEYLKMISPGYQGEDYYKCEPAVTDGRLVTASGIAPLEFALHVLRALDVCSEQTLASWYKLYKTQEAQYFLALMDSLQ